MSVPEPAIGIPLIFKPAAGFESIFQGKAAEAVVGSSVADSIPFYRWDEAAPSQTAAAAGKPGFDPNLINMGDVPYGARLKVQIPVIANPALGILQQYRYTPIWRDVSQGAYREKLSPRYSLPRTTDGAPDTGAVPPERKVVISTVQCRQVTAAGLIAGEYETQIVREWFVPVATPAAPPDLNAAGTATGTYTQGVSDPAVDPFAKFARFVEFTIEAQGDQLGWLCERVPVAAGPAATWDFATGAADVQFSQIYGTAELDVPHPPYLDAGIYVFPLNSASVREAT